jgi:4-alpha-glucanotransferase
MGILPRYTDQQGHTQRTTDSTRELLLAAMGFDVSDAASLRHALQALKHDASITPIQPVAVCRIRSAHRDILTVQSPSGSRPTPYRLVVRREDGRHEEVEGTLRPRRNGHTKLRLPVRLHLGYHSVELTVASASEERVAVQRRIVCPDACYPVRQRLGQQRGFGIWANLYSVRSRANHGVGDLTDLAHLTTIGGEMGACFIASSPLGALRNRGTGIAPYSPLSRLYRNELYLDVTAVPEFRMCSAAQDLVASAAFTEELGRLRRASHVDYAGVTMLKHSVLRLLFETFEQQRRQGTSPRYDAYHAYVAREGDALLHYATFRALDEHHASDQWTSWPAPSRDPQSPTVRRFQQAQQREIDFHRWLQFELDTQVRNAATAAEAHLSVGLLLDMPLGSSPDGSDAWQHQDLFVRGAHLGAPPDEFAPGGQDWGLCPLSPVQLARQGYEFWIQLMRANMRSAGALRIDHMMGLFRQFWIPSGEPGAAGAYVAQRAADLLGILALESRRHGTIVVGEDLGTLPRGFQALLHRWGILSSRVLYFERTPRGTFRRAPTYSNRALVTAHTHDQAPLAGYWKARDLELRHRAGAYGSDRAYHDAVALRTRDRRALTRRLQLDGLLPLDEASVDAVDLGRAVHAFLAQTPAPLLGVSLDDLCGETDPVNLPGVPIERFPSWSRRLPTEIDELARSPAVRAMIEPVARVRGSCPTPEGSRRPQGRS